MRLCGGGMQQRGLLARHESHVSHRGRAVTAKERVETTSDKEAWQVSVD